jgi:hypothetical protein
MIQTETAGLRACVVLALLISGGGWAQAALIDRGNGMIYDTVLNVTWLQDVTYARTSGADADGVFNFADANNWANSLVYGGYTDWRLPTLSPVNGSSFSSVDAGARFNGSSDYGFNIAFPGNGPGDPPGVNPGFTGNELAYMFNINLGNFGEFKVDGSPRPGVEGVDWGLVNTSFIDALTGRTVSFLNLRYEDVFSGMWTNTEVNSQYAWAYLFRGFNDAAFKPYWAGAWAVRDGDVIAVEPPPDNGGGDPGTIPVPATVALLMSLLPGMWLASRRRRVR